MPPGAADLDGPGAWARERQRTGRDRGRPDLYGRQRERNGGSSSSRRPPTRHLGRAEGQSPSPTALARLKGLADTVRHLRTLTGLGLAELAAEAEVALGLDIEVLARTTWSPGAARAHLDRLRRRGGDLRRQR